MITQIKSLIFIFAFFVLVFSSCKKEGEFEVQETMSISQNELKSLVGQVKVWHDSTVNAYSSSKIQSGIRAFSINENDIVPPIIDWSKAFINFDSSSTKSITVPISINYKNWEHMQLVATKSKNKLNGYYIKATPDSSFFAKNNNIFNYSDFSGSISIYDLMGVRIKKEDFKKGIVTNSIFDNKISQSTEPPIRDLVTVIVRNSKRYVIDYGNFNFGYIYISGANNFDLNEYGGGYGGYDVIGDVVIAGGGNENLDDIDNYFKFPIKSDYKIKYPKFTNLVKNIYEDSRKVPKLLDWLKAYTMLSDQELYNALQFNQGPTIIITDLNGPDWGGATRYGHFDKNKKVIEIDKKLVTDYEKGIFKKGDAYSVFLAATLLHETVHYGRYKTGHFEIDGEYGRAFQLAANYGNYDLLDK